MLSRVFCLGEWEDAKNLVYPVAIFLLCIMSKKNSLKIVSWNVNGIRAILRKGELVDFLAKEKDIDILCLQETRGFQENIDTLIPNYQKHWVHANVKKGYSGTAIFLRKFPENEKNQKGGGNEQVCQALAQVKIHEGIGDKKYDQEGRVLTAETAGFFLVCVYTPNSGEQLRRLDYRVQWDKKFMKFIRKSEKKKPVVFCGDLNVAHREIDLARPDANHTSAGFTKEERAGFDRLMVKAGFIDTFREFETGPKHYTWWSYKTRARERNVGWRIDYCCISKSLRPFLLSAFIRDKIYGSDHCPVGIELSLDCLQSSTDSN